MEPQKVSKSNREKKGEKRKYYVTWLYTTKQESLKWYGTVITRHTDQWDRTENPEINQNTYQYSIHDKGVPIIQMVLTIYKISLSKTIHKGKF